MEIVLRRILVEVAALLMQLAIIQFVRWLRTRSQPGSTEVAPATAA